MRTKKEFNICIGEQIKIARENAKLTQEQLAEKVEVSPQYVSDLERGVVGISLPTLKKVCVATGISSDQILFGNSIKDRSIIIAERCTSISDNHFEILMEIISNYIRAVESK